MVAADGISMWLDFIMVEEGGCWLSVLTCLLLRIREVWDIGKPPALRSTWWCHVQLRTWCSQEP